MSKCVSLRLSGLLGALALISTQSFAALFVYPAANATVEGNSSDNAPLGAVEQHFQQVFNASLLTGITPGSQILSIAFRVNGGLSGVPAQTVPNFEIRMSQSARAPGSMSAIFAENWGVDDLLVRSGPLQILAGDFPGGSSPNAFGEIPFSTPYYYNGGHLLIEVAYSGFALGRDADAVYPYTAGLAQTAFGSGYASTTADAGLYNEAILFELNVDLFQPVPEPAQTGFIAAGILGVCITLRQLRTGFQGRPQSVD